MEDRFLRKDTSFANEKFPTSIAENMTRDKISHTIWFVYLGKQKLHKFVL